MKEQFADWVKGINIADAYNPKQYIPPIPRESIYFSFNYTNTLQQIYAPFQTSKSYIFTAIVVTMTISYLVIVLGWKSH
ncbi:hypothetical protein ACLB1O_18005 [Escherichia coli]